MATPQYIKDAQNNYNAKFDLVQLKLPRGTKDRIRTVLEDGMSITAYCARSVLVSLESDEDFYRVGCNDTGKHETNADAPCKDPIPEDIEDGPNKENGFDGLKAMDWIPEKHRGIVPRPPFASPGNATWDAEIREWCEPLPFD